MMITKQHRGGKSVRQLLDYCFREDQAPEIVGGTMSGRSARELAREFAASRAAAAHLSHPVMHWSISYQQADMDAGLTAERRGEVAREVMRSHLEDDWAKLNEQRAKRGLEPFPKPDVDQWDFVVVAHRTADGKANPHDHLVAIRANRDGYVYHAKHSHRAAPGIDRDIERRFSLAPLPDREHQRSRARIRPTDRAGYVAHQRDRVTVKDTVARDARVILDGLTPAQRSVEGYASALAQSGLCLHCETSDRGRHRYYIGKADGVRWRADRLGFKGQDDLERLEQPQTELSRHHHQPHRGR